MRAHQIAAVISLAFGLAMAYLSIYTPLQAMFAGAPSVTVSTRGVIATVVAIGAAPLFLFFCEDLDEWYDEHPGRIVLAGLLLVAAGSGVSLWIDKKMASYDYAAPLRRADKLAAPVSVTYRSDGLTIVGAGKVSREVEWRRLEWVSLVADPGRSGPNYVLFWELYGGPSLWIKIPVDAANEERMPEAIRKYLGRVDGEPVKDMRASVEQRKGRQLHGVMQSRVWTRTLSTPLKSSLPDAKTDR